MTKEIENIGILTLLEWLSIRDQSGLEYPNSVASLKINIFKSSLLSRMLEGKVIYPYPPPTSFSYPWYYLLENKADQATMVWEEDGTVFLLHDYKAIYINQHPWKIIKKISDNEFYCVYSYRYKSPFTQSSSKEMFSDSIWHICQTDAQWFLKQCTEEDIKNNNLIAI